MKKLAIPSIRRKKYVNVYITCHGWYGYCNWIGFENINYSVLYNIFFISSSFLLLLLLSSIFFIIIIIYYIFFCWGRGREEEDGRPASFVVCFRSIINRLLFFPLFFIFFIEEEFIVQVIGSSRSTIALLRTIFSSLFSPSFFLVRNIVSSFDLFFTLISFVVLLIIVYIF